MSGETEYHGFVTREWISIKFTKFSLKVLQGMRRIAGEEFRQLIYVSDLLESRRSRISDALDSRSEMR
jgi:hypothetical protein